MNNPPMPTDAELPERGRLFGIDYGTKRVGIAVSDIFQEIASPLHNYTRISHVADVYFYQKLAEEYEVKGLIVGLPLHVSGDESQKSSESRGYAEWLSKVMGVPHTFQDERYSSLRAESMLMQAELNNRQRKSRIDKVAAQILLQEFLQRRLESKRPPQQVDFADEDSDSAEN